MFMFYVWLFTVAISLEMFHRKNALSRKIYVLKDDGLRVEMKKQLDPEVLLISLMPVGNLFFAKNCREGDE